MDTAQERQAASAKLYAAHPYLPPFSYRAIGDTRLWHGRNPLTAWDVARLKQSGITHVLDLRQSWEWGQGSDYLGAEAVAALDRAETGVARWHIPVADGGTPSPANFADAVMFLETTLRDPDARVFVHCRLGRERTGAILAAYYAVANDMPAHDAISALNAQGAVLDPNDAQRTATQEWVAARMKRQAV